MRKINSRVRIFSRLLGGPPDDDDDDDEVDFTYTYTDTDIIRYIHILCSL